MSIHLHVTLEVHAAGMAKFCALMEELVPIAESVGWKLKGAFVQRTGRLNNVIDLWELDDFNHFDRGIQAIAQHADSARLLSTLAETVASETIVFADKAPYMRRPSL
jgi:hypothetical protein